MASRKTYFGIGWPKDAADPESGVAGKSDAEDRSAPTVVDDEKVAEGLRQLRSWYQGDTQSAPAQPPEPARAAAPVPLGARPTAVGHATAPTGSAAAQRPVAPDPMRATMYGHDVHRFDLDAPPASQSEPPRQPPSSSDPPPSSSTALIVASEARQPAEAVPSAVNRPTLDPFQPVRLGLGEAERIQRPARRSGAYQPPRQASRVPLASRIMFGFGVVALLAAVVFWYQSGSAGSSGSEAAAPPAPAPASAPSAMQQTTPAAAPAHAAAPSSPADRAGIPSTPTPILAAPVAGLKTAQLRLASPPGAPAPGRTWHRHREVKPAVEPTEVDGEPVAARPPAVDKLAAPEAKDIKPRPDETAVQLPKQEPKLELKKEPKDLKEPAAPALSKETKEAKESKPSKPAKETKARSGDVDATLPPSLD